MTLWSFMAGLTTIPDEMLTEILIYHSKISLQIYFLRLIIFLNFVIKPSIWWEGGKVEYKSNSVSSALIPLFPFPSNTDLDPLIWIFLFQKTIYSDTSLGQILPFTFSYILMTVISPFLQYLTILSKNPSNPYLLCQC